MVNGAFETSIGGLISAVYQLGLASETAREKLKQNGFNELPGSKPKSIWRILFDVLKEPIVLILVCCGILYLFFGSLGEGIALGIGVIVVLGITLYQERRAERTMEKLKDLSNPRALVIRDGEKRKIESREIVVDDIMLLSEGDRIPADAILLESLSLSVDESILTGESVAVVKTPLLSGSETDTDKQRSTLFSGCMVVQGKGLAKVIATGGNTRLGEIGRSLNAISIDRTPLQIEIGKLVKTLALFGLGLCFLLAVVYYFTRHDFIDALLSGLSLAMAMLPEEFPVVLTIFIALGAWRIAKAKVLARNPSGVEALGAATVLCTDKTGTITQNIMSVESLFVNGKFENLSSSTSVSGQFYELINQAVRASEATPVDPMEKALIKLRDSFPAFVNGQLVKEYPLSPSLMAMSRAYKSENGGYTVAAKGAPETIFKLCSLTKEDYTSLKQTVETIAGKGLRVIGVAKAKLPDGDLPVSQTDIPFEFCGLIGLADPIRPEVPKAIAQCYTAGIRVIMITGDYPVTAINIAQKIGLKNSNNVITGVELDEMCDEELKMRILSTNIFARIRPEQKLRIVETLKALGEVVAMTGDGVNDSPALKSAHIGIAMGQKGTDVAREAASLVLLDDNFASIVSAIRVGRRISDNLQKAFSYVTAIHVPIAGLSLIPVFAGLPVILWPIHIAFHELVIDPVSSVVFESQDEERDIMTRPPRKKGRFFDRSSLLYSLIQGISGLTIVLIVYLVMLKMGLPEMSVRTACFITLVAVNLSMVLVSLSTTRSVINTIVRPTNAVKVVLGIVCLIVFAVVTLPFFRNIFRFELFPSIYFILIAASLLVAIIWFEILKRLMKRPAKYCS
jgi:Ca2+-transporting ATPase